jgi:hypothetical protein
MRKIALLYRKSDAPGVTGRIFDALDCRLDGVDLCSVDETSFDKSDYEQRLLEVQRVFRGTDVLITVIGQDWLNGLDNELDGVRIVVRKALESGIRILPLLVNHAHMPSPKDLPKELEALAFHNAFSLDPGSKFSVHIERVVSSVKDCFGAPQEKIEPVHHESQRAGLLPRWLQRIRSLSNQADAGLKHDWPTKKMPAHWGQVRIDVFISHASADRDVAEKLCSELEKRGINCWLAFRDIRPGENFQESIVQAIRNAKLMILIFTASANNSNEIKKELVIASQNNLTVIPVRVEDVIPNDALAYELTTRQWIDLFRDWERSIDQLGSRVEAVLKIGT